MLLLLYLCRCILGMLDTDLMSTTINCESKTKYSTLLFPEYISMLLLFTSFMFLYILKKCIDTHIIYLYLWKLNTYVTHGASSLKHEYCGWKCRICVRTCNCYY